MPPSRSTLEASAPDDAEGLDKRRSTSEINREIARFAMRVYAIVEGGRAERCGLPAICPRRDCLRLGACGGVEADFPCLKLYREEARFLDESAWSIPALRRAGEAGGEPARPDTPGLQAYVARALAALRRERAGAKRSHIELLFSRGSLARLRRPLGASKGRPYEVDPDAFARALLAGDWRGPLLP